MRDVETPFIAMRRKNFIGLIVVNFAMMATHYYNVFWLAAQGVFYLGAMWSRRSQYGTWQALATVAITTALPLAIFALTWGPVVVTTYDRFGGNGYASTSSISISFRPFIDMVVYPTIAHPRLFTAMMAISLVTWLWANRRSISHDGMFVSDTKIYAYVVAMLVGPLVFAGIAFAAIGEERYNFRYFIFSLPVLMAAAVLLAEQAAALVTRYSRFVWQKNFTIISVALALVFILPRTHVIASRDGRYERNIASTVTNYTRSLPGKTFVVYEAGPQKMMNFYFRRMDKRLSVTGNITTMEQRSGNYAYTADLPAIEKADVFLVVFAHTSSIKLAKAIEELRSKFPVLSSSFTKGGRGYIAFDPTKPAEQLPTAAPDKAARDAEIVRLRGELKRLRSSGATLSEIGKAKRDLNSLTGSLQ